MLFISVLQNLRIRDVLKQTFQIYKERQRKLKTSALNEFIKKVTLHYPPPAVKGKNLAIKYGTQVHHSPPIFAFFTNHPQLIPVQYKRYMENNLRDKFGFSGVPIKISFRLSK
jgi:GTP-binding protein